MKLVSVIIPVYNSKGTIAKCLRSVLSQSYERLEVLLIDDGSTDGSAELCRSFRSSDERVRCFEQTHRGVSATRNAGLDNASGEYICFLDSDDYVPKDYVEQLVTTLERADASLCHCGCYSDDIAFPVPASGRSCLSREEALYALFRQSSGFSFAVWNKIFRRELIGDLRFDESFHYLEDGVFVCEYLLRSESMAVIREPLYHHVSRPTSLSRNLVPGKERWSAFAARKKMLELVTPVSPKMRRIARAKCFEGATYVLFNSYLAGYTKEAWEMRDELRGNARFFLFCTPAPVTKKVRYLGYALLIRFDLGQNWARKWESLRWRPPGGNC